MTIKICTLKDLDKLERKLYLAETNLNKGLESLKGRQVQVHKGRSDFYASVIAVSIDGSLRVRNLETFKVRKINYGNIVGIL